MMQRAATLLAPLALSALALAAPREVAAREAAPDAGWAPPATATTTTTTTVSTTTVTPASATLRGVIYGHDEARLAGVEVTLSCPCLAGPMRRVTDAEGRYSFDALPPGRYTIEATIGGAPTQNIATLGPDTVFEADFILESAPPRPPAEAAKQEKVKERHHAVWGGVGVGLVFAPFRPAGSFSADASRITTNQMDAWSGPIRGIDVRWQTFDLDEGRFPRTVGYFRSGYTQGAASFTGAGPGDPTALSYLTVPLFLGGNLYLFRDFPIRPYAGLGFGLDVMRLEFARQGAGPYRDVSARVGFELHGGVEVRITNHLALTGEVMQLWSARRRLGGLPDVSNESFTAILGITGAFEMRRW